jgi:hypothetical protein
MMQDLKTALGGGQQMDNTVVENPVVVEEPVVEPAAEPVVEPVVEEPAVEPETPAEPSFAASEEPVVEGEPVVEPEPEAEPVAEPAAEPVVEEPVTEPVVEEPVPAEPTVEEQFAALQAAHEELQASYSTLETEHQELQTRFAALETAHAELVEFKRQSDDAKKDEMIGRFYMLSDEDKADVLANKANYTVEDIEEKLSVICFRKKVNFELEDNSKNNNNVEQPAVTYNMSNLGAASKPDWLIAVDNAKAKNFK